MKSYYIFLIAVFTCFNINAQNISDVVRYGNQNIQGTARFQALSGAFGALGGDLSAINVNPAGSAVFNYSQFTASGTNYNRNNDATFFNTDRIANTNLNSTNINQVGGVLILKSPDNTNWKKIALAANYEIAENFENEFSISGRAIEGLDNYFTDIAQGSRFGSLLLQDGEFIENAYLDIGANLGFADQQAFLGYFGGIIDPVDRTNDDNTSYNRNAIYNNNTVFQDFIQTTRGYNSKLTLNASGEYQDNLYIGASLNFHVVDYDKITQLRETGYDPSSPIQFSAFDNLLHTDGGGVSFNIGAISKLNDNIRVGASYQSPTWYFLTDETSQRIDSDLADEDIRFINFDVINVFDRYTIQIPSKLTGSIALIFGKDGLLSFDYGYQDMSNAELRSSNNNDIFQSENEFISNELTAVSTYKIGGEYRIKQVSLRGGYRFEQSPYENATVIGDLEGYSAGIGYNFGGSKLDLAINRTEQDINEQLFDTGVLRSALNNYINTNVTLSYTMNF